VVGRQNADIADTVQLSEIATATTFSLPTGYDFGCVVAIDTLFDSMGWEIRAKLSDELEDSRDGGSKECCHGHRFWTVNDH